MFRLDFAAGATTLHIQEIKRNYHMYNFEIHKGLKERRGIKLELETDFVNWLMDKYCSCLVSYYYLSIKEIRKYYYEWKDNESSEYQPKHTIV